MTTPQTNSGFTVSGKAGYPKRSYRSITSIIIVAAILTSLFLITLKLRGSDPVTSNATPSDSIFQYYKVHEIHLNFKDTTAWKAMAPFGGMIGVQDWFDISAFITTTYLHGGDHNFDREFTREEFMSISDKWFNDWDTGGKKMLDANMIAAGWINSSQGFDLRGAPGRRNGIAAILGIQIPDGKADVTFNDQELKSAAIRYKGNGTLFEAMFSGSPKFSFKIDLNDGFPGRGYADINKLNIHNLLADPGYMTDAISYRLFREAGVPAPRTSNAKVYLTVPDSMNNKYIGLYRIIENVDNNFAMYWYGTKKGAIFKPVTPDFFQYMGDDWNATYVQSYDPKSPLSNQEITRLIEVCKFVTNSSDEEFSMRINEYFDIDNLARFMAVNVFLVDIDGILGPGQNVFLYLHPKTLQFSLIPWDQDQAFGRLPRGGLGERDSLSIDKPWMNKNVFVHRLFNEPQFKTLYHKYMHEFHATIFKPERIHAQIDELIPIFRPAIAEESKEKLKKFDAFVGLTNEPLDLVRQGGPGGQMVPVRSIREFITIRHKLVAEQLEGKSSGLTFPDEQPDPFVGQLFLSKMDSNKDSLVSKQEFDATFEKWYTSWSDPQTGIITYQLLADGINADLSPYGPDPRKKKREPANQ